VDGTMRMGIGVHGPTVGRILMTKSLPLCEAAHHPRPCLPGLLSPVQECETAAVTAGSRNRRPPREPID
jgi:hypothetical protein